jgi:hypothetical protein
MLVGSTQLNPRSALLSFRFVVPALVGSLTMALVSAFASASTQVAVLGGLVSILAGLFHSFMQQDEERERNRNQILERLSVPLALVSHQDLYDQYLAICQALNELAQNGDPILREMACLKLASVTNQIASLAAGTVVFSGTEAWRTVYDQILKSPDVKHYRSVAWVRSPDYWQDPPGRQSMQANFTAAHRGVLIERAIILHDPLWPRGDLLPRKAILPWIEEQHNQGLWLTLVRQSDLASESELLCDQGIYGDRAVGLQELDEHSRTIRFTLSFDAQNVRLAHDRWERLGLYTISFRRLLDKSESDP